MADKSKIAWTDATYNPIVGCSKVSAGCLNCFAEKMAFRLGCMGNADYLKVTGMLAYMKGWNGKTAFVESALEKPLHWRKPRMIFVCSMGDLFHESVPFEWIDKVFAVMALCSQHTFQVLTKRAERMKEYFKDLTDGRRNVTGDLPETMHADFFKNLPFKNVMLGVTAENQEMWDKRKVSFLNTPAALHFVSNEPLLSGIRYTDEDLKRLNWIIVGSESKGRKPGRHCNHNWIHAIRNQCKLSDTPLFVKQITTAGKLIKDPASWPREFPAEDKP